jgi:hypothetical protein
MAAARMIPSWLIYILRGPVRIRAIRKYDQRDSWYNSINMYGQVSGVFLAVAIKR